MKFSIYLKFIFTMSKNNFLGKLVEADGSEPTTYSLQSYRSPN